MGINLRDDKYNIIVKKGTELPIMATSIVKTSQDNQMNADAIFYYGEDEVASKNTIICEMRLEGLPELPIGQAKMKYIVTIDIYGKLIVTKYSLDNDIKIRKKFKVNALIENV